MGWVNNNLGESQSRLYPHMRAKFGRGPTAVSKKVSFKFISKLYYIKLHAQYNDENVTFKSGGHVLPFTPSSRAPASYPPMYLPNKVTQFDCFFLRFPPTS